MTFLGLERPVEYQRQQIFDPTTANMVLNAQSDYVNAVYNDYLRGLEDMKEFNKTYGDFMSPIQKDMDWYNKNVTGKVRDFIANAYAQGIDPLRSAEGRAAVSQLIYSMPTGDIAKVRQSAEAAKEYIKNRGALQRAGKYDADLNERFLGYDLNNFDTINGGSVWNVTSPLEAMSLKDLTEKSFNNRTPLDLTKSDVESFGIKYDPNAQYTGFAKRHLQDIADRIAPGLYGTPYFDYYRDLAKRRLEAAGIDPTKKNIDTQLARDIADSQEEYLMGPKADYTNFYKRQELALRAENNRLQRQKFNYERQKDAAAALERSGVSQWEQNYNDALANAASDSYTKYDPLTVNQHYDAIGKTLNSTQKYFGSGLKNDAPWVRDEKFKNRYTKPVDVIGVLKAHGGYKEGESSVLLNRSDILRLRSEEDVLTNTQGNYSKRTRTSKKVQDKVREALKDGTKQVRMYPYGTKYGAQSKDNVFDIDAPADIIITDKDGNIVEKLDNVYWDTRWGNRESLYHQDPGPDSQFRNESSIILGDNVSTNAYPSMWDASSVLPSDTRGTKADYAASPSVKLGTSYK